MEQTVKLSGTHYHITSPWNCDCVLCKRWQEAQVELEPYRSDNSSPPSKEKLAAERKSLVAELRLDFWSELCFYAKEEQWRPGWGQKAWNTIQRDERTWVMQLQYITMEEWLNEFAEFSSKAGKAKEAA